MLKISISADIRELQAGRLFDKRWANNFPGALWACELRDMLKPRYEVVTADVALSHILSGYWNVRDLLVIQHMADPISRRLIELGAFPLIITAFESPLYAGDFYDNLSFYTKPFHNQVLFSGSFQESSSPSGERIPVKFPAFSEAILAPTTVPWGKRKKMVAIFGNKYTPMWNSSLLSDLEDVFWRVPRLLHATLRGQHHSAKLPMKELQLQDRRLHLTSHFLQLDILTLYGTNWQSTKCLPPKWRKKFQALLTNDERRCGDKFSILPNFQYCLCLENTSYPGYVTEKIIHCLYCGVIPLYQGAPDILNFVPEHCFIDISLYENLDVLAGYLENISEVEATRRIAAGKEFLNSRMGRLHSYEGFARQMVQLIEGRP